MEREVAEILLGIKAVTLKMNPPYTWASGIISPIYTDNRILMSFPAERKAIVNCLIKAMEEKCIRPDVIAGTESAGIPWASWLADRLDKPMIYVRKAQKQYGKENLIEGILKKGQKVLIVEDLISTGGSSVSVVNAVRNAGGNVEACLAIFTYGMKKSAEKFAEAGCRLITLSNFGALIKVATEMSYITNEEAAKINEWSKDPEGWGKKMGFS